MTLEVDERAPGVLVASPIIAIAIAIIITTIIMITIIVAITIVMMIVIILFSIWSNAFATARYRKMAPLTSCCKFWSCGPWLGNGKDMVRNW